MSSLTRTHRRMSGIALLFALVLALGSIVVAPAARAATGPAVVQTIDTSRWSPPSPDPSGITYWPRRNNLVMVDGEVEEMAIWAGANVFQATLTGTLVQTYNTTSFNKEPVGIDIEIGANDHFYITNDSQKTIFDIDIGPDQLFGTPDDKRRPFLTSGFGNGDPEGLTLGGGKLYTVDGAGQRIYVTEPGSNGIFEASDPTTSFSVVSSIKDPEGIDYDEVTGNLWVVDRSGVRLVEMTTSGTVLRTVDLKPFGVVNPGDVTLAPASNGDPVKNLYVAARGVDNNVDPRENDGKIYEITLNGPVVPIDNLLENPGFELDANGDSAPDGWSTETLFTRSSTAAHSSTYSGRFAGASSASITVSQKVTNTVPGTSYAISGWVNIPATTDAFTFTVEARWRNGSNAVRTDQIVSRTSHTAGQWTEFTSNVAAPAGSDNVQIRLLARKLDAIIYVDDLRLKP